MAYETTRLATSCAKWRRVTAIFYHSSAKPPGAAGIARICCEAYPDPTQFDQKGKHYDPKSKKDDPRWSLVDVEFVEKFAEEIPLQTLKEDPALEGMRVTRKRFAPLGPAGGKEALQACAENGRGEDEGAVGLRDGDLGSADTACGNHGLPSRRQGWRGGAAGSTKPRAGVLRISMGVSRRARRFGGRLSRGGLLRINPPAGTPRFGRPRRRRRSRSPQTLSYPSPIGRRHPVVPDAFSTWFFLARPTVDRVVVDDGEIDKHWWALTADALAAQARNGITLAATNLHHAPMAWWLQHSRCRFIGGTSATTGAFRAASGDARRRDRVALPRRRRLRDLRSNRAGPKASTVDATRRLAVRTRLTHDSDPVSNDVHVRGPA